MKIGVVFPQTDFGTDIGALREYTQVVEELGFHHVLAFDHVLGADLNLPGRKSGPYTHQHEFYEVFELFTYMSALAQKLNFATGILVLPQRQTSLVAKQAATLDLLTGGKFRLGVGIGWNQYEYEGLGVKYKNRGKKLEEQVQVLRKLWASPLVSFDGKWHNLDQVGINPLPAKKSIPVWFGGGHENVLRRIGEIGNGWMPQFQTVAEARESLDKIKGYAENAGRSMDEIGIDPRLIIGDNNPDSWKKIIGDWKDAGATHTSVNTLNLGWTKPSQHIDALKNFAKEIPTNSFE